MIRGKDTSKWLLGSMIPDMTALQRLFFESADLDVVIKSLKFPRFVGENHLCLLLVLLC